MMLGEPLKAQEAERLDMIYKAVKDDQFEKEVRDLAAKLAMMPTKALGLTKRALNVTFENELSKQLAIEEQLQFAASRTADYKEGVQAFLEKRKPDFHGA
jgi:2-(1,2-epoxy-1,2-dihydrophenyl)acetyl-CoA isomerase